MRRGRGAARRAPPLGPGDVGMKGCRPARRPTRTRSPAPCLRPSPACLVLRAVRERQAGKERAGRRGCGLRDWRRCRARYPGSNRRTGEQVAWMRILSAADRECRARGAVIRGPTNSVAKPRGFRGRRRPAVRRPACQHEWPRCCRTALRAVRQRAGHWSPRSSGAATVPRAHRAATGSMHRGSSFVGRRHRKPAATATAPRTTAAFRPVALLKRGWRFKGGPERPRNRSARSQAKVCVKRAHMIEFVSSTGHPSNDVRDAVESRMPRRRHVRFITVSAWRSRSMIHSNAGASPRIMSRMAR